jgi:hypothetical protein
MIDNEIHKIKTTPYLVELKEHAKVLVNRYDRIMKKFEEITLDGEVSRFFMACKDEYDNLMLVNKHSIHFIHYGTAKTMKFTGLFEMVDKMGEIGIKEMMDSHASLRIKI